jgi:chorismate mutase
MPQWELNPHANFPQTPELYLEQIEQEFEALDRKKDFLVEERIRVRSEIARLKGETYDGYDDLWAELDSLEARKEHLLHLLAQTSYGERSA